MLEKLSSSYCDEQGKPYQEIMITHTIILEDPYPDPPGLCPPSRSPSPPLPRRGDYTITADENLDEFHGLNETEVNDRINQKTTRTNLKLLEVIGDIGDSEELPPENVLFVCKLHPRTNSEDLSVIFSKFGLVISAEIIRDQKTDDSLCYGFIEFENTEDCSNAYFKMDNVLIDDRRIHVDFCQSLANKASSHGDRELSSEGNTAGKEEYGLVFDNMELLRQAMRKKAKEARSRNRHDLPDLRDQGEGRKRRANRSPERSPIRKDKKSSRHSPEYLTKHRHHISMDRSHGRHSFQRPPESSSHSTHHRSRSDHKHRRNK